MKVIVSHDVDHLTVSEHFTDLIIPKFIVRMNIELAIGRISTKEVYLRWKNLFKNKWNNINELISFNLKYDIPGTFFVGVNNGLGLNYGINQSEKYIKLILKNGFDCGIHGISTESEAIFSELKTFREISGLTEFGIRMHYLRNNDEILTRLSNAGYIFDSTDYGLKKHYKIGEMYEFPLHIMEVYETDGGKKWQTKSLQEAIDSSVKKIKQAEKNDIMYLSILFHDFYFNDSFLTRKKWYYAIIEYCKSRGFTFINYRQALGECMLS